MQLETLALLSQIAGAIAVIASLIFVGFQIREQANATPAQTEQAIAANWMGLTQVIADKIIVWGTVGEGPQKRSFECDYGDEDHGIQAARDLAEHGGPDVRFRPIAGAEPSRAIHRETARRDHHLRSQPGAL